MKKEFTFIAMLAVAMSANAQNVLTVTPETTAIEEEQAGSYDRVVDAWTMEAGNAYLLSLPAALDGYYFGQDASRQHVTSYELLNNGTYSFTTAAMEDLEDFKAGEVYLVVPNIDVEDITHITPGVNTDVPATAEGKSLLCVNTSIPTAISEILGNTSKGTAVIYDLQGRAVKSIRFGETYIMNGKKVIFKQ